MPRAPIFSLIRGYILCFYISLAIHCENVYVADLYPPFMNVQAVQVLAYNYMNEYPVGLTYNERNYWSRLQNNSYGN